MNARHYLFLRLSLVIVLLRFFRFFGLLIQLGNAIPPSLAWNVENLWLPTCYSFAFCPRFRRDPKKIFLRILLYFTEKLRLKKNDETVIEIFDRVKYRLQENRHIHKIENNAKNNQQRRLVAALEKKITVKVCCAKNVINNISWHCHAEKLPKTCAT